MWTVFDNLWDWESEVHQQVLKLITENLLHVYIIKMFLDSANHKNYMYWSMVEYSSRSSSHHYLFATCMFHCMIPKLVPHDGLQDTSVNKDCIEFIVLFFNREFDLPWEVDASKGPARSSRPGRSRWFSEDPFPPPLLQHCQYCVHGSTVCPGVTVQLVLYCRWCTVFFLYNYLFSEFPVSLELPLYKLLKSFSDTRAS